MRESEIRKLIKLVEESDIGELEVSRWGKKVIVRKYPSSQDSSVLSTKPQSGDKTVVLSAEQQKQEKSQNEIAEEQFHEIRSPMVGTFYRSPAPDAKFYVEDNDRIVVGQVVCLIEAMKILNEIESDVGGTIVSVAVENSSPIEYGQTLFLVRPD